MRPRAAWICALLVAVLAIGAGVWWRLSQRSPDVDAVIAAVQPGDPLGVVLVPLGMGDCWRKRPDTGEMVCHYPGVRHSYAVRIRHSAVVEVARDQRLGGKELPPFNHPVDVVFAPE